MKAIDYLKRCDPFNDDKVSEQIATIDAFLEETTAEDGIEFGCNIFTKTDIKFICNYYRKQGWSARSTYRYPNIQVDPIISIKVPWLTKLLYKMGFI